MLTVTGDRGRRRLTRRRAGPSHVDASQPVGPAGRRAGSLQPMFWRILPHATACFASEQIFLLDVRQDRYFLVPPRAAPAMASWLHRGFAAAPPPAVLTILQQSGICREGDAEPTNALKERVQIPDGLSTAGHRGTSRSLVITRRVMASWLRLRLSSLNAIVERRRWRPPFPIRGKDDAAIEVAAAFERSRSIVQIARNCLLDSIALDGLLAKREIGCQWVFGISPRPFAAHCWLQTQDVLLNDSFDHVSGFTPILAL